MKQKCFFKSKDLKHFLWKFVISGSIWTRADQIGHFRNVITIPRTIGFSFRNMWCDFCYFCPFKIICAYCKFMEDALLKFPLNVKRYTWHLIRRSGIILDNVPTWILIYLVNKRKMLNKCISMTLHLSWWRF